PWDFVASSPCPSSSPSSAPPVGCGPARTLPAPSGPVSSGTADRSASSARGIGAAATSRRWPGTRAGPPGRPDRRARAGRPEPRAMSDRPEPRATSVRPDRRARPGPPGPRATSVRPGRKARPVPPGHRAIPDRPERRECRGGSTSPRPPSAFPPPGRRAPWPAARPASRSWPAGSRRPVPARRWSSRTPCSGRWPATPGRRRAGSCGRATRPAPTARCRRTPSAPSSPDPGLLPGAAFPAPTEPGFGDDRFEQLDGVARRVLDEELLAADAGHDVFAEVGPAGPEPLDEAFEVDDLEAESVPAAGRRECPVRHGPAPAGPAAGGAEHEPEIAAGEHGEGRRGVHDLLEVEETAVEVDRLVDVVDDVADAHAGHGHLPSTGATGPTGPTGPTGRT